MKEPFDPNDPYEQIAEAARQGICDVALRCSGSASATHLNPGKALEMMLAGMQTGIVGVALALTDRSGHDEVFEALTSMMPKAREQAESMIRRAQN